MTINLPKTKLGHVNGRIEPIDQRLPYGLWDTGLDLTRKKVCDERL